VKVFSATLGISVDPLSSGNDQAKLTISDTNGSVIGNALIYFTLTVVSLGVVSGAVVLLQLMPTKQKRKVRIRMIICLLTTNLFLLVSLYQTAGWRAI